MKDLQRLFNPKFLLAMRILLLVFLLFAFWNWSINPGTWSGFDRVMMTILFFVLIECSKD